jgi:hypothetical protein
MVSVYLDAHCVSVLKGEGKSVTDSTATFSTAITFATTARSTAIATTTASVCSTTLTTVCALHIYSSALYQQQLVELHTH